MFEHRILVHSLLHKEDSYGGDWWTGATYSVDTLGKGTSQIPSGRERDGERCHFTTRINAHFKSIICLFLEFQLSSLGYLLTFDN